MLRSGLQLNGYRIDARDGEIGKARDLLFDDSDWVVRYLVVDTGTWLPGRRVLVSPASLGQPDWVKHIFPVALKKEQIEHGPPITADRPVSRQLERKLVDYFAWPMYWAPGAITMGSAASGSPPPPVAPRVDRGDTQTQGDESQADPHLRSMREVTGYHVQARDGEVGHVEDFIVDDDLWTIRYVVVDTRNWLPGRKVILAPGWFERFDWHESKAITALERKTIKDAPAYDPSQPVNRDYEGRLYDYYGRPGYWTEVAVPRMSPKV